jgi:hypothetical protein
MQVKPQMLFRAGVTAIAIVAPAKNSIAGASLYDISVLLYKPHPFAGNYFPAPPFPTPPFLSPLHTPIPMTSPSTIDPWAFQKQGMGKHDKEYKPINNIPDNQDNPNQLDTEENNEDNDVRPIKAAFGYGLRFVKYQGSLNFSGTNIGNLSSQDNSTTLNSIGSFLDARVKFYGGWLGNYRLFLSSGDSIFPVDISEDNETYETSALARISQT